MLNYLACCTHPDLAVAVSILSRFNQRPGFSHWKEVIHCWKYLKGTQHFGLVLKPDPSSIADRIQFFTNATWAEDQETRISQSGSLAFWKSCPILWNSKKQKNITMSSTESELNTLSDDVKLIPSEDMVPDALTKAAPHASIQKLQDRCLSVHSSSTMEGC
ncbi:hypothetical protein VP01_1144g6 [Puccinia sorghi]|uniref:Retrovirus-related Pol polyprotein from transposon TNT 1-94 n=1 Tax=Puccinia sorghi TaxID=27349 RepID=A0A0L6VRV3_9BASI|nr:hypothetical protein VP01_1144g6 [Puccinia sorghi]